MMKLCEVLRQYRWAAKISAREFAAQIGISAATLSRIERGEIPSGSNLAKVVCWLLKEGDEVKAALAEGQGPAEEMSP